MDVSPEDLTRQYSSMSERELMELARQYDHLIPAAQFVLRSEFARRGLEPPLIDDSPDASARTLVTVRSYRDLTEAMVARSLLEAAGIEAWIRDENTARIMGVPEIMGTIRLQVDARDESAAREVLDQPLPDAIPFGNGESFAQPRCPQCSSLDVCLPGPFSAAAVLNPSVASAPIPSGQEGWVCNACGAAWQQAD
jgi:hypothetical protein